MRFRDRIALLLAGRMGRKMTPARREAFFGLRTFSLSDFVLFPASVPSSKRLVKEFPFSIRSGRTRKVFCRGKFVSVVESGIGAPSVELVGNLVCKGGAKVLLRVDFCGALSPDVAVGDIFIASAARSFDQVARHYYGQAQVPADSGLLALFTERLRPMAQRAGIPLHVGQVCTVDLFFAQTDEMLRKWAESGEAVDMETAAVYAIAKSYNVAALAVMVVTDNKLLGHLPYSADAEKLKKIVAGHGLLTRAVREMTPSLVELARSRGGKPAL
ncbi:MAG TPA: hypothetical protein VM163_00745 [bacterium]|nr:hypothetical protein [bacterium]